MERERERKKNSRELIEKLQKPKVNWGREKWAEIQCLQFKWYVIMQLVPFFERVEVHANFVKCFFS